MKNNNQLLIITILLMTFLLTGCNIFNPPSSHKNEFITFSNHSGSFSYVNYETYKVRTVNLEIPDSLMLFGWCLSTEKDHILFAGMDGASDNYPAYLVGYNIAKDTVDKIIPLGLNMIGAPRLSPANIIEEPGLVYLYTHLSGLHSINYITEEVELISSEMIFPKNFFQSNNKEWIVRNNYYPDYGVSSSYTVLEFYTTGSKLSSPSFILNENDVDSIDVIDMVFSEDNSKLYLSYLLSQCKAIGEAAFFGSYDLDTKEFNSSNIKLPWCSTPYYISHNPERDECYMISGLKRFYIIDTETDDFFIKDSVDIPDSGITDHYGGSEPSRILLSPNGNRAFISCIRQNCIYVVNLETIEIVKTISLESPYHMLLLE